ncbi:MAG TPA: antitoxin [Lentisphaeria bacterium]|nr:MAG: hypothetical protein A2X45_04920 [Lentisphaerae bacterium GWF2_50_93]HCE44624.1 antitoxin [Lentisphaeria bacterium]
MVRTQIQLPEHLYREVKKIASERELSLAELTRRGLEYVVSVYLPKEGSKTEKWMLPESIDLGGAPLVSESDWRELANESMPAHVKRTGKAKKQ